MLSPALSQPLVTPVLVRLENTLLDPLKQYALDNNLGDKVSTAAKNLISEGLAGKGYLRGGPEAPAL